MATQELSPEFDEDIFELTEIVSSDDDVLDLSLNDKVEDSSSAPSESSSAGGAPTQDAPPQESAPPPPPKPVPENPMQAEDMDLDDLLSQLESGEDLKDESYGLPQQNAEIEDDFSDLTEAINAKREAFDANLADEENTSSASVDPEESDLDDLLSGLDSPDVEDDLLDALDTEISAPQESADIEDDFSDLDNMEFAPISERDDVGSADGELNLDDLESLLDDIAPDEKPKSEDPFDDLDDFLDSFDTSSGASTEDDDDFSDLLGDMGSSSSSSSAQDDDFGLDLLDSLDSTESPAAEPINDDADDDIDFDNMVPVKEYDEEALQADKEPIEDNDEFADLDNLFDEYEEHKEIPITASEDIDNLLGEFSELTSEAEEKNADEIDVEFPDDLDDFIKDDSAALDPMVDDSILDIDTSEEAESIEFANEDDTAQSVLEESSDIASYIDEFDVLPNKEEEILTIEDEMPKAQNAPTMPNNFVQTPVTMSFDNTNNQTQFNLLFAEFRLLGSEIAELKRRDKTTDTDIFLPVVGKELSCKDIEENLTALRAKLMRFEKSLSTMQGNVQNVASDLAVDAEGEERSSIDNFIMEMSESFDKFSRSLTLFDNKISEMEKANTEMETSMTVLRTKVEKNAAKIELLSTRIDNVDATFENLENIVANTAARIIREELAAMLAEENGDVPYAEDFQAPKIEEENRKEEAPLDLVSEEYVVDDLLDLIPDTEATSEDILDQTLDLMPEVEASEELSLDEIAAEEEINLDEMLDAPIETLAQENIVDNAQVDPIDAIDAIDAIDPIDAINEEVAIDNTVANAVPEEFDMDALFDAEEK